MQYQQPLLQGALPAGLVRLSLGYCRPLEAATLSPQLRVLRLSGNQRLRPGVFPFSLQFLFLDGGFNRRLRFGVLPSSLQFLSMSKGHSSSAPTSIGFYSLAPCRPPSPTSTSAVTSIIRCLLLSCPRVCAG